MPIKMNLDKPEDEVWTTEKHGTIKVGDMTEEHAKNCLRLLIKRNRRRAEIHADSPWYNMEYTLNE